MIAILIYTATTVSIFEIFENHKSVLPSFNLSAKEGDCDLLSVYWIPKRFMDANCIINPLLNLLTFILTKRVFSFTTTFVTTKLVHVSIKCGSCKIQKIFWKPSKLDCYRSMIESRHDFLKFIIPLFPILSWLHDPKIINIVTTQKETDHDSKSSLKNTEDVSKMLKQFDRKPTPPVWLACYSMTVGWSLNPVMLTL